MLESLITVPTKALHLFNNNSLGNFSLPKKTSNPDFFKRNFVKELV